MRVSGHALSLNVYLRLWAAIADGAACEIVAVYVGDGRLPPSIIVLRRFMSIP